MPAAMEGIVQSSTIISLGKPTDSQQFEIPLTIFDRFASSMHVSVLYAFSPPTPSNSVMIESLVKALHYFPTLAGELGKNTSGRPCVRLGSNNGGVLVVEATVASKLADHLPLKPSPEFVLLLPPAKLGDNKLLNVQLNRFACGGLVIGVTSHHRVADGQSMSVFFVAWGQIARGLAIDPLPVYDKSWLTPRQPPRSEFQHWGYEFVPVIPHHQNGLAVTKINDDPDKITNILLHYSLENISNLKASLPEKYTTFVTLLGHLWRKITIARKLEHVECTQIRVSVNGRTRLNPPVPREFIGNLVLNAYPKANVGELIDEGTATAARIIHEAVKKIDDAYFKSLIDFGAMNEHLELIPTFEEEGNILSPSLEVLSWTGFRFHEVSFGGGGALCGFMPPWVPVDGVVVFLPTTCPDGGVDVFVSLRNEHAEVLKEIAHSLD